MTKTRLPRLKRLRGVPRLRGTAPDVRLPLTPAEPPKEPLSDPYAVYPPFNSRLEVAVWQYIATRSPYWELQVQFGRTRVQGNTRVDFLNRMLMVALYPDGEYWHRDQTVKDTLNRAQLTARGFRVVQWMVNEPVESFAPKIPGLYASTIGN